MFIVSEDFDTPPFELPNLDEVNNSISFDDFVTEQEEEILRELLGDVFYEAFVTGLDEDPIPQRWIDLRDGVGYTDQNDKIRRWVGIEALLKPAIYAKWISAYPSTITGGGAVVVVENENSTAINPSIKILQGQNKFANLAGACEFHKNTLYQYLFYSEDKYLADIATENDSIEEYLDDNFCVPELDNEFDL